MKNSKLEIVVALNYYAPYVSGLTEAARIVAEALVERGHRLTVVACRHDRALPAEETINGVRVVRTNVVARIGKGLVSPSFAPTAVRLGKQADVVHLHMPMLESGVIARGVGKVPVVATYQCDISLPDSAFNRVQTQAMDWSNRVAIRRAAVAVSSSEDYARHSRLRVDLTGANAAVIPPPTLLRAGGQPSFRDGNGPHVGFLGRLVEEKGVEYLVDAFTAIEDPDARLLIAGDYLKVAGGSVVDRIRAHVGNDPRIRLLGFLRDDQLADFYASLDVFALPSVNAFEAFGIVQVEAMRVGVAALASDLPGVRQPVLQTGFGAIARPRDVADITSELSKLLHDRSLSREEGARRATELYAAEHVADRYESVLLRAAESRDS